VVARLEIGARRVAGRNSRTLARTKLSCRQRLPHRQHHCPIAFEERVAVGEHFPCRPSRCFANLVVSAHSRKARGGERMIIGANKPNGRIVQNKSRLNAIRLGPGVRGKRLLSPGPTRNSMRLRARRKVLLSRKVSGLEQGDVVAASATLRSDVRHLGYNALVGAELIVARGPNATAPSRLVRRSVWQRGLISPINGTNCTPIQSPCRTRKVGVVKVRRDVRGRSGTPAPLFVNMVVRTKQKRVGREHGDRLRIRDGGLELRRYPAP
jgi:hypothetical protein